MWTNTVTWGGTIKNTAQHNTSEAQPPSDTTPPSPPVHTTGHVNYRPFHETLQPSSLGDGVEALLPKGYMECQVSQQPSPSTTTFPSTTLHSLHPPPPPLPPPSTLPPLPPCSRLPPSTHPFHPPLTTFHQDDGRGWELEEEAKRIYSRFVSDGRSGSATTTASMNAAATGASPGGGGEVVEEEGEEREGSFGDRRKERVLTSTRAYHYSNGGLLGPSPAEVERYERWVNNIE